MERGASGLLKEFNRQSLLNCELIPASRFDRHCRWHRIDLLFFHRLLKCLVVIDLKIGKLTHTDTGQMTGQRGNGRGRSRNMIPDCTTLTNSRSVTTRCVAMMAVVLDIVYRVHLIVAVLPTIGRRGSIIASGVIFALIHVLRGNPSPENQIAGFMLAWAYSFVPTIPPPWEHGTKNISASCWLLVVTINRCGSNRQGQPFSLRFRRTQPTSVTPAECGWSTSAFTIWMRS